MNDHDIVYEIVYIDNNITAKINKPPQRKKYLFADNCTLGEMTISMNPGVHSKFHSHGPIQAM